VVRWANYTGTRLSAVARARASGTMTIEIGQVQRADVDRFE
jgi:hypothetical protein